MKDKFKFIHKVSNFFNKPVLKWNSWQTWQGPACHLTHWFQNCTKFLCYTFHFSKINMKVKKMNINSLQLTSRVTQRLPLLPSLMYSLLLRLSFSTSRRMFTISSGFSFNFRLKDGWMTLLLLEYKGPWWLVWRVSLVLVLMWWWANWSLDWKPLLSITFALWWHGNSSILVTRDVVIIWIKVCKILNNYFWKRMCI